MPPKKKKKKKKKSKHKSHNDEDISLAPSSIFSATATALTDTISPSKDELYRFDQNYKVTLSTDASYGIKLAGDEEKGELLIKTLSIGVIQATGLAGVGDVLAELDGETYKSVQEGKLRLISLKEKALTIPFTIQFNVGNQFKLALLHESVSSLGLKLSNFINDCSTAGHLVIDQLEDSSIFNNMKDDSSGSTIIGWSLVSINGRSLKNKTPENAYQVIGNELNTVRKSGCSLRFESPDEIAKDMNEVGKKSKLPKRSHSPPKSQLLLMTPIEETLKTPRMTSLKDKPAVPASSTAAMERPTERVEEIAGTTHIINGFLPRHRHTNHGVELVRGMDIAPAHVPITLGKMHLTIHKGKRFMKNDSFGKTLFSVRIMCNNQIMRTHIADKKSPIFDISSSFLVFDTEAEIICTVFNHPSDNVQYVSDDQISDNIVGECKRDTLSN